MSSHARVNPLGDLTDFAPKSVAEPKKPAPAALDAVAEVHGFPSRQAPSAAKVSAGGKRQGRRYTTGRNQQLNIKVTPETSEQLYRLADARRAPLGEVLKLALDALEREGAR